MNAVDCYSVYIPTLHGWVTLSFEFFQFFLYPKIHRDPFYCVFTVIEVRLTHDFYSIKYGSLEGVVIDFILKYFRQKYTWLSN